jgi:alpha-L-fucosidase
MKRIALFVFAAALCAMVLLAGCNTGCKTGCKTACKSQVSELDFETANRRAKAEFADAKFGIFIHWGIYSMLGQGEWALESQKLNAYEYKNLAAGFYPSKFNAVEWVSAFKNAGAKYLCITTRHHDGFSMFKTAASDFNIVDATPFKRDIIKELADECRKQGLKIHFYYSILDWTREDYWPLGKTGHNGRQFVDAPEEPNEITPEFWQQNALWQHYIAFMKEQLTELLTNYGEVGAIWFDGLWDREYQPYGQAAETWDLEGIYALIHQLQPSCLVGNNHHLPPFPGEDIQIFEQDLPGENTTGFAPNQTVSDSLPLETCRTMNNSWGYRIKDTAYKSSEELIEYMRKVNGMGANLLLNIGPRPDGTLPDEALERLAAIGEANKGID